jgi:hypothetical protein
MSGIGCEILLDLRSVMTSSITIGSVMKVKSNKKDKAEIIGSCPICNRDMVSGPSIDKHHLVPKCKGGRITEYMHKICHRKIHSIWTEKELAETYNEASVIIEHEEMQKFIKWVKNKDPEFYDKTKNHNRKKK